MNTDLSSRGFRAYRSRVYTGPTPSSFSRHTVTSGPEDGDTGCGETDHDSCAFIYRRLHGGSWF